MTIRIGIAGFGNHALGRILPVIESDRRLQVAAAWTRSESSQTMLRKLGFSGVTGDFAQFLSVPMDVVYIASPTGLHAEHAAAVLNAGLHVWVEKPIATSLEDVHKLVALAESRNLMLTEAFMFPWHAQANAIKRVLAEEALGRLRFMSLAFCFPHLAANNFRYRPELGGGAFLDHACYLVKALDVYANGTWTILGGCLDHAQYAVDITGAAQLRRDEDGLVANLNWGFGHSYINEMQVIGERRRMQVESAFTKPAARSCDIILEDTAGKQSTLQITREDPYGRMIEGFIEQYADPAGWHGIRQDILRHAERYFALRSRLQHYQTVPAFAGRTED